MRLGVKKGVKKNVLLRLGVKTKCGSPVWFAPSSLWGLAQRSKRDRDPTTGNGFVPKYFGVEGMQFSTFPQSLSILYSNANMLDPDLARIGPS
jgi:hypothetical protein